MSIYLDLSMLSRDTFMKVYFNVSVLFNDLVKIHRTELWVPLIEVIHTLNCSALHFSGAILLSVMGRWFYWFWMHLCTAKMQNISHLLYIVVFCQTLLFLTTTFKTDLQRKSNKEYFILCRMKLLSVEFLTDLWSWFNNMLMEMEHSGYIPLKSNKADDSKL